MSKEDYINCEAPGRVGKAAKDLWDWRCWSNAVNLLGLPDSNPEMCCSQVERSDLEQRC